MSDAAGLTSMTAPASVPAADPTAGGSSVAPHLSVDVRSAPIGYGGYTGVSDGAPYSATSAPAFEDSDAASVSPIIIGVELLAGMTPMGAAAELALMTVGIGYEIYETVHHFGEAARGPAGEDAPHAFENESGEGIAYRITSLDARGMIERVGEGRWRVFDPQVRKWGTRTVTELPPTVSETDLSRGRVIAVNITAFEPSKDAGLVVGTDGRVYELGRKDLTFGGFDDLGGGLGKLG